MMPKSVLEWSKDIVVINVSRESVLIWSHALNVRDQGGAVWLTAQNGQFGPFDSRVGPLQGTPLDVKLAQALCAKLAQCPRNQSAPPLHDGCFQMAVAPQLAIKARPLVLNLWRPCNSIKRCNHGSRAPQVAKWCNGIGIVIVASRVIGKLEVHVPIRINYKIRRGLHGDTGACACRPVAAHGAPARAAQCLAQTAGVKCVTTLETKGRGAPRRCGASARKRNFRVLRLLASKGRTAETVLTDWTFHLTVAAVYACNGFGRGAV